jgi:hypothetical protein
MHAEPKPRTPLRANAGTMVRDAALQMSAPITPRRTMNALRQRNHREVTRRAAVACPDLADVLG